MPGPGFMAALQAKYSILGRQADAAQTQANAALAGTEGIGAYRADEGYAARTSANAALAGTAGIGDLRAAQGGAFRADAFEAGQRGIRQQQLNVPSGSHINYSSGQIESDDPSLPSYHTGTANVPASPAEIDFLHQHLKATHGLNKVPGKGPSTVDTVPAMLAPREAVLNEHAADLIGRDKIAAANAIGVAHQKAQTGGMVAPKKAAEPTHQKLSGGTHMVGHGKSAKTPSKIDPQALLSLMGAMQGGQAPGGAAPAAPGPIAGRGMGCFIPTESPRVRVLCSAPVLVITANADRRSLR